jgi:hypothetical protein
LCSVTRVTRWEIETSTEPDIEKSFGQGLSRCGQGAILADGQAALKGLPDAGRS